MDASFGEEWQYSKDWDMTAGKENKSMKKTLKKLLVLSMVVVMIVGMATTAFAASGTTVNLISVRGYLNDAISLSNVVGTAEKSYSSYSPTYICNAPAEIKLLRGLAEFSVEKKELVNGRLESRGYLPINGQVSFWDNSLNGYRTVDYKDFEKYNVPYGIQICEGATVTLNENGIYFVYAVIGEPIDRILMYIIVDDEASPSQPVLTKDEVFTAAPTSSKVQIADQHSITLGLDFDAYNINGNNYFKLRDLAYVLNGSRKQFEVEWDGVGNAIILTSNAEYTPAGGEMGSKGTVNKTATPTASKILLDGKEIAPAGYNIGGNNYFKLRDMGQLFDFGVTWDGVNNRIIIDTSISYTP